MPVSRPQHDSLQQRAAKEIIRVIDADESNRRTILKCEQLFWAEIAYV